MQAYFNDICHHFNICKGNRNFNALSIFTDIKNQKQVKTRHYCITFLLTFTSSFIFQAHKKTKNLIYASGSVAMRTHTLRRICLKKYVKIFLGMFFQQVNNTVSHLSLSTLLFFLVFLHLLTKIKSSLFFILVSIVFSYFSRNSQNEGKLQLRCVVESH